MKTKILCFCLIVTFVYPIENPQSSTATKLQKSRVVTKRVMAGVGGGLIGAGVAGLFFSVAMGEDEFTNNMAFAMMAGNAVGTALATHYFNGSSDFTNHDFNKTMLGSALGSPLFLIPGLGLFGAPIGATIASTTNATPSIMLTSSLPETANEPPSLSHLVVDPSLEPTPDFGSLSMKGKVTFVGVVALCTVAGGIVGAGTGGLLGASLFEDDEFGFNVVIPGIVGLAIGAPTGGFLGYKWLKK